MVPTVGLLGYWCAPGTGSHLHVPGATGSGEMCVLTHIEPNLWKLPGGEVGLEKHTSLKKKLFFDFTPEIKKKCLKINKKLFFVYSSKLVNMHQSVCGKI